MTLLATKTLETLKARRLHYQTNKWGASFVSHRDLAQNRLLYVITFRNGVRTQHHDVDELIQKASAYAEGVKRLTGEFP